MNQATLGSLLTDLYDLDFTHRVDIELQATGDVDAPAWAVTLEAFDLQVQQPTAQERLAKADDYGGMRVTHIAFCNDAEALVIGCRLVEKYRLDEQGHWDSVEAADAEKWLVLGKEKIRGLPEPWEQVRLDLNQMTPTR